MQQPRSLVLLGAISSVTAAAAGSLPRGVGPECQSSYYVSKTEFTCVTDASIKLSWDRVNDNTCDCPDGSDEPGTAACAYLDPLSPQQPLPGSPSGSTSTKNALPGFWCVNKGHIGSYVPFVYVNDGVCDYDLCCDGSEEFAGVGGIKCENRCDEIGKEHRKLEEEKRKNMEKAEKKRKTMAKEAKELRRRVEVRLADHIDEIKELEAKKADLQKKLAAVELQEKGKVVRGEGGGGKLGVLVGVAKTRVNELRNTLDGVLQQRNHLRAQVDELETILRKFKEEYNPNFNDEGVKAAVKSFEDYSARQETDVKDQIPDSEIEEVLKEDSDTIGVNWKEFEELGDDTDIRKLYNFEAYLPTFLRNLIHDKVDSLRVWLIQNGMLADSAKPGSESHLVKAAREAVEAADRELNDKIRSRDDEQEDLKKDYGPEDIFRALKGKTVSIEAGEYTYELTWLERTSQNSKKGHGNTNMGNFVRIDREMADDEERLDGKSLGKGERMVMRYDNGQGCWNGPQRRTDVWLGCAEKEELWRVSEAEKCVYKMEVGTPAACEPAAAKAAHAGKDEL
ncbi:glucosidase 2 subunit beta precursor [Purpureocillium lilacinum]|uniref:Glucosidase 2 subunit beta n=1 Tax=Purpureocillium lilacinum TaxID=33203 RepID=A0A179GLU1_PURLI|nr:glucosidase 2 subunit beta precursor [Purpureocillium lilacinum]